MLERKLKPGDPVVYLKTKRSPRPGPRASHITPQQHGEGYTYQVEKFWRVREVLEGGKVLVYTRSGKQHVFDIADRNLHRANPIKYLLWRNKFPPREPGEGTVDSAASKR